MLYVSDLFENRYPAIFNSLTAFSAISIIPNTKDIWIRDFMPIKNAKEEYILFNYYPKYLSNPKYHSLISNNKAICESLNIDYTYSDIVLDGGSVVYRNDLYFISERILKDNPRFTKNQLIKLLSRLLQTDKILLIPEAANDFTGHLDGVLYIVDEGTLLVNDYKDAYLNVIRNVINAYNFDLEILPYNPYGNKTLQSAKGIYINFVDYRDRVFVPIFNQQEDEVALKKLEDIFPTKSIIPINCNQLANEGGLLHCVTWEFSANKFCE